jgi:hypothetical protein
MQKKSNGQKSLAYFGRILFHLHRVFKQDMYRSTLNLILALASLLAISSATASDTKLYGCWLNDRVVQSGSPGLPINRSSKCAFYFDQKTFTSACPSEEKQNAYVVASFTYEIISQGEYLAKVVRFDNQPNVVGSALKYVYQAEEKSLFLMSFPQTAKPVPFSKVVRDESVSIKVSAKTKEDCLFKAIENSAKSKGV